MCQWQLMLLFLGALMIRVQISDEGGMDAAAFGVILIVVLLCGPLITAAIAVNEVRNNKTKERALVHFNLSSCLTVTLTVESRSSSPARSPSPSSLPSSLPSSSP